eukprot:5563109-Prymnesium_polylepis.1
MHRDIKETYLPELRLAQRGAAASARKALKAGREPPNYSRLATAQQQLYTCKYGCTPHVVMRSQAGSSQVPLHAQAVPWVAHDPGAMCSRLEGERFVAVRRADEEAVQRDMAENSAVVSERARAQAEQELETALAEVRAQKQKVAELEQQT